MKRRKWKDGKALCPTYFTSKLFCEEPRTLMEQTSEVEVMQSMFSGEGEFALTSQPPEPISFTLNIPYTNSEADEVELKRLQIDCFLPRDYPQSPPRISVGSSGFANGREGHQEFMAAFQAQLLESIWMSGELCIYTAVQWIQENIGQHLQRKTKEDTKGNEDESGLFMREWIWFHHIYGKQKRRNLISWAKDMDITGFSLVGKPGVICVEGRKADVVGYVQMVRALSWQKMSTKLQEEEAIPTRDRGGLASLRKFQDFKELGGMTSSGGTHRDIGEFLKFLEEHGLAYVFSSVFGLEPSAFFNSEQDDNKEKNK